MIGDPTDIQSVLEANGIDVLVATSLKNVYYTSGIWTTPTVTPGEDNHSKTGLYTDYSPPKSLTIVSADDPEPSVVVPPVVTTHIPDEGIDVNDDKIYIFGNRSMDPADLPDDIDPEVERVFGLFETTYEDRAEALTTALDGVASEESTIALENSSASSGPADDATYIEEVIRNELPHSEIVEGTGALQEMRQTKTDEEIERLRTAANLTESTIMESLDWLETGLTEKEYMIQCKQRVYEQGALEQLWVDHNNIGFGHRTAYPHVVPSKYELQPGDLVRFEFGCRYEHYPADLARTFVYKESDTELEDRYQVVKTGMDKCEQLLGEHRDTDEIIEGSLERLREEARSRGIDDMVEFDAQMIGHNIGLDIHDPPLIARRPDSIEPGMVMNYEIMATQWGRGGIQLEETALITEDGIEPFTSSPDELLVID